MRHILVVGMARADPCAVAAQPAPAVPIERHVVYGMQAGPALLMHVHRGPQPIGLGVVVIQGTAWHASPGDDNPPVLRELHGAGQLTGPALDTWILETGDRGHIPEPLEVVAAVTQQMHDWFGTSAWHRP